MRQLSKSFHDDEDPEAQRRSYSRIIDTEADDFEVDSDDSDYFGGYDDESDGGMDEGPTAFWEAELSQLRNSAINEAMLHQVPWDQVGKQFTLNLAAAVAPLAVHTVIGGSTLLQLPIFIIAALVLVISAELVAAKGPLAKALFGTVAIAIPLIASIACHLDFQNPMAWVTTLTKFIGCSWMACSLLVVLYEARRKTLYKSDCYNALTGRKVVELGRMIDIVKLAKAMTFVPEADLKDKAGWFVWTLNTYCSCRKRAKQQIALGMVSVDKDPMVPPVALELDGQELDDGEYRLVRLVKQGREEDPKVLQDLQTILKRKGRITDQLLMAWLDTNEQPQGLDKLSDQAKDVKKWFFENDFNDEPFELYATASNIDRVQGLLEHWAPRALVMSAVAAVFSLPARYFYANLLGMQVDVCKDVSSKGIRLPGGELLCSSKSECASLCLSQISFIEAVNRTLHTSHVESLFIFVLLPIFVFIFSVAWVEREHQALEKKYLKGMGRNRSAIREVTNFKTTLENIMKTSDVWSRFLSRFQAWNPYGAGDPDLSAKRSLKSEASQDAAYENRAFEYVVNQITSIASPQTVDEALLGFGLRVDPAESPDDKENEEEQIRSVRDEWNTLKSQHNLGGSSQRNFAVAFTVGCRSELAWKLWKKWLFEDTSESGYKKQLDYIFSTQGAQDSGTGSHLNKSVVIGDQAVPKGFSLTHIRTRSPQDNSEFVIDIGSNMTEAKLKKEVEVMEKMLCAQTDEEFAPVTLKERLSDLENECEIAVRFVLSEQYWSNYTAYYHPSGGLLPPDALNKNFAEFVGHMLQPIVEKSQKNETEDGDDCDMTVSYLRVIMGEDDPMTSLVATGKILLVRVWVAVLCMMFMLITPLFRVFMQGGKLFPQPFETYLALNMVFSALALYVFLNNFQIVTERLSLVAAALAGFEQRTIDPSGKVAKAAHKSKDKKKERQEEALETRPFDLTVNEGQGIEYDPTDEYWVGQWKEKQDNVQNWHLCVGYIRVFVSSSRLTAQAILLAAGFILAFVLVLSFVQGLQGKGVATIHGDVLASKAIAHASDAVSGHLDQARRLSLSLAKDSIMSGLGTGAGSPEELSIALATLRQELHSRMGEMSSLNRRLGEDAASMVSNFDATKVTKTQVLTMAMVVLLMFYSVPLLWNVAKINDCFDRHGNLLLGQKEVHRMNMARREAQKAKKIAGGEPGGEAAPQADPDSDPVGATLDEEASPTGDPVQPESNTQDKNYKDLGVRRYEKMVDMAIQAANKNKTRFPLKLFGFTINLALLTTWIVLAVSPLAKEAQQMAPGLAVAGCHYLEHSQLVQQADHAAASLGKEAASVGLKVNLGKGAKHFSMKKLVKEVICKPLIKFAKEKAEAAAEDSEGERRLSAAAAAAPAIAPLIKTWWGKHPGNPYAKFFGVTQALHDLEHEMSPQPLAAPVEALLPTDHKMEMLLANDLQSWLQHHDLPESINSKLKSEAIDTVAKLAMLSDDDVNLLCQGEKLGDKAAAKLLVKAAQDTYKDASKTKRSYEL